MYLNKIKVLYFSLNYLIGFTFSTFNTSDENLIKKNGRKSDHVLPHIYAET